MKVGTMRYITLKVSSSLLYVWLTTLCLRMYHMIASVVQMKMTFMAEL